MRWQHPKRGMISPAEFVPLAEETEAIIEMGEWALRTACRDAAAGLIPGTVAVNLSPVQFKREDLAETIHRILLETGLSPKRLEVEVTKSAVMSDQSHALHVLRKLKAMGISVAMDDFGTGYSSLSTLHVSLQQDQAGSVLCPSAFERRRSICNRPHRARARPKPRHARAGGRHRDSRAMAGVPCQ